MIVSGGGLSAAGDKRISFRPGFFLPVQVSSRLFHGLFIEGLAALHRTGKLNFLGELWRLADPVAFAKWLAPLHKINWVVYAKPPFGGPDAVLSYLSRYTHRVAISNSRLITPDARTVTFGWNDCCIKRGKQRRSCA